MFTPLQEIPGAMTKQMKTEVVLSTLTVEQLRRIVLRFDKLADEAAASDKPWALRNLRLYQNMGTKAYACYAKARRELKSQTA
jgi:hypothetical protein